MVRRAEKRSRFAASCCNVDVVNGGAGFLRRSRRLTSVTPNGTSVTSVTTAVAAPSSPSVNALSSILWSLASNACPSRSRCAVIDQYSS